MNYGILSMGTTSYQRIESFSEVEMAEFLKIAELDTEISSIITELLSQELIRSQMASSMWNDSIYVARIGENLLEVMELLYTAEKNMIPDLE